MGRLAKVQGVALGVMACVASIGCQNDENGNQAKLLATQNQSAIEELETQIRELRHQKSKAEKDRFDRASDTPSDNFSAKRTEALTDELEMLQDKLAAQEQLVKELEARLDKTEAELNKAPVTSNPLLDSSTTSPSFGAGFGDGAVPSRVTDIIKDRLKARLEALGEDASEMPDDFAGLLQMRRELNIKERNKEMGIDDATAERLSDIEESYVKKQVELRELLANDTISQEQFDLEYGAAKDSANNQLDALLTPDQKEIYDNKGGLSGSGRNTFVFDTVDSVGMFEADE